jgi:hypothetical protein
MKSILKRKGFYGLIVAQGKAEISYPAKHEFANAHADLANAHADP